MNLYKVLSLTLIFYLTTSIVSFAQGGIKFYNISVKAGIVKAKQNGKFLFVDTYAEWCIPCKKMKKVFVDSAVSEYFNKNYINVKINMDGPNGRTTYNDYDVVFLPTMMIFDHEGEIKYKTDKLLTADELLNIGIQANVPGVYLGNNASQIISTPFQSKSTTKPKPKRTEVAVSKAKKAPKPKKEVVKETSSEGQIVKIIGANDEMPPEVLYQEAYYQLQRMNNSHGDAAIAYLKTQENWDSEKNVKFIYDFVESANSLLFDYIKENRNHVASIVGESNLAHSLDIIVNQRIYQGYPRPDLQEAIELYSLVDTFTAEQDAYQYYLGRMLQESNKKGYLATINKYLTTVAPNDHYTINKAVEVYSSLKYKKSTWNHYKKQIDKAIDLNPDEARYYVTLAKLYLAKGDRKKAKKSIDDALEIMNENTGELDGEISDILERISKS